MLMDRGKFKKLMKEDHAAFMSAARGLLAKHVVGHGYESASERARQKKKGSAHIRVDVRAVDPNNMDALISMMKKYFDGRGIILGNPEVVPYMPNAPVVRRRPCEEEVEVPFLNRRLSFPVKGRHDSVKDCRVEKLLNGIAGDLYTQRYLKQKTL